MLDVYGFIADLKYDDWADEAKNVIAGDRFFALQEICASIDNIATTAGLEVLYFFLDEIIKEDYIVNTKALECFLDILPNFCSDVSKIEDTQRQLWTLGNFNAKQLIFRNQPIGKQEIEAAKIAACYIFGLVKKQVKKYIKEEFFLESCYSSVKLAIIECMEDPEAMSDTKRTWKDKTASLVQALFAVQEEPEVRFDDAINLINEIQNGIWTVSLNNEQADLVSQVVMAIPNEDNRSILTASLEEMHKKLAASPEEKGSNFRFSYLTSIITLGLVAGITASAKAFGLTASAPGIVATCGLSLIAGTISSDNLKAATDAYTKLSMNGLKISFLGQGGESVQR